MVRSLLLLSLSLALFSLVGCGADNGTVGPGEVAPMTAAEEEAMENYNESHAIDPKTGQPAGQ
ncbi:MULTISPECIES: hypothetical protein [Rhodopirellula]|uniref:hypothetical protein n=1 Tax=Rhodopirellula TaxID=265488 RepID=UPI002579D8E8|nr:hypothetical protein [Rhodopirellula sp. UBA1907]|tara:strand:- start:26593 stop:26781 length:189 start_codon:yes stop_codon:yes gene_type:complete